MINNTELACMSRKHLFSPILKHINPAHLFVFHFFSCRCTFQKVHCIGKKWKPLLSSFFFVSICCFIMICSVLLFPLSKLRPPSPQAPTAHNCSALHCGQMLNSFSLLRLYFELELGISEVRKKLLLLNQYTAEFFCFFCFF